MSDVHRQIEVDWLIACLAPRDVAPHPNFSVDQVRPAELLALIVEHEYRDYSHYRDLLGEMSPASSISTDVEILDAARDSFDPTTIAVAMRRLADFARDTSRPVGQRAAAALLSALAGSDQDDLDPSVEAMESLLADLQGIAFGSYASRSLVKGTLAQQIAIREFERGRYDKARSSAVSAIEFLANAVNGWEDFTLSKGVDISPSESQRRVALTIEMNARSLVSAMAEITENLWVDIVKSSPPIAEIRSIRHAAQGLGQFLDEQFKRSYPSGSSSRTFRSSDVVLQPMYASLINAELTGSLSRIRGRREEVGQVQAVRGMESIPRIESLREATRLLRQSDSEDAMRRVLRHLRQTGPLTLLRELAQQVLRRSPSLRPGPIDLHVLESAADLLSVDERREALAVVFNFAEKGGEGRLRRRRATFNRRIELSVKAAASLVPNASVDTYAATEVLDLVQRHQLLNDQSVFRSVVAVASAVDWGKVSEPIRQRWYGLFDQIGPASDVLDTDVLRLAAVTKYAHADRLADNARGLERVAAVINGWIDPSEAELNRASETCRAYLSDTRRHAEAGMVQGYAFSPAALAGILVSDLDRVELWPEILETLKHSRAPAETKVDVLRALTRKRVAMPEDIQLRLRGLGSSIASGSELAGGFTERRPDPDLYWRGMLLIQGILSIDAIQAEVVRNSASAESDIRSMTAELLASASREVDFPVWAVVVLLHLSHDADAVVRHWAARGVAYLSWADGDSLSGILRDRASELLSAEGISDPLGILQGLLQRSTIAPSSEPLWCQESVRKISSSHLSANVRAVATKIIDRPS